MYKHQAMIFGLETIPHCRAPKMAAATMLTTTPRLALPYKSRSCAARSCSLLEYRLTRASDAVERIADNPITGVICSSQYKSCGPGSEPRPDRIGIRLPIRPNPRPGMKEIFVSVSGPIKGNHDP